VLLLTPKKGQSSPFTRAKVWVDNEDGLVRQFQVEEASGVTRHVRLTSLKVNVPVNAGAFSFAPPAGVRVIER
jgi:outer membrane lipoprotein-sorting protein